jgi:DNA-binding SARP family transcriptional activator
MGWIRRSRGRRSRSVKPAQAGMVQLPPIIAQGLLAMRERERLSQRRAMIPGAALPEGATLRAARQAGLHPAVDPIGTQTRAALVCWEQIIGGDVPETIAAWAGDATASILLAGPVDPAVGVPHQTGTALGLEVGFRQYGRWKPDNLHQLVLATVEGPVTPGITPDRAWAADGLLVPFGSTHAGVLYLPLLGPSEAGPLSISGPAANELLASILIFALARVGARHVQALVYQDLVPYVEGLIEAEPFDAQDLEPLRRRLEEEWKRRALQIGDARADDIHHYALLPDKEPIPLLVLLIGAQAATEMGLLDPDWPYVLRKAGRKGISIIVWGDVATAPRRVHASRTDATFVLDASAQLIDYELPRLEFTPVLLERDVRAEVAAVLGVRRTSRLAADETAPTEGVVEEAVTMTEEPRVVAQASAGTILPAIPSDSATRHLYLLGGVRAEYSGAPIEGWRRRQALELLAFLAAHPGGRSVDAVLEAIWPDAHAKRARTHLRQLTREVRLRFAGDPGNHTIVLLRDCIYRLDWQNIWADVEAFRRALAAAGPADDLEPHLREAVSLYRGEFCKDAYYSWSEPTRQELERAYLGAVVRLTDRLLQRGALDEAQPILDAALTFNPYVDALVQRAIVLDTRRLGMRAARDRLATFRTRLREELDAEPDPETLLVLEKAERDHQR